jgi:hypothetical protein
MTAPNGPQQATAQALPPCGPPARFCVGLDLGRQADFSALASLEWPEPPAASWRPERVYGCTTLRRWPLGTPYLAVARDAATFFRSLPAYGPPPLLAIDATGVGDAVYELVWKEMGRLGAGGRVIGVHVTGGSAVSPRPGGFNVAKKALVSNLQALMGRRRLRVASALPDAKALLREFDTFTVKITDALNESFGSWRERDHDDLVFAVALAAWAAERLCPPPARPRPQTYLRA